MRLKIDLFTWIVIGIVIALVVAAIVTVNLTSGQSADVGTAVDVNSPAAPIAAAYLAVQRGDVNEARAQFTADALAEIEERGYDPIANSATVFANSQATQRVRIISVSDVTTSDEGLDEAYVTLAEDNFSGGGGLFGRSTWSNQRIIRVERQDGAWKVDDPSLFY